MSEVKSNKKIIIIAIISVILICSSCLVGIYFVTKPKAVKAPSKAPSKAPAKAPSSTPAKAPATQEWVKKGCFMDSNNDAKRVIPAYTDASGKTTQWTEYYGQSDILDKCKNLAKSRNHNLMGVQFNGACFTSDKSVNYNQFGPVKTGFTCGDNGTGGSWTNNIYILEDPKNPSQIPKATNA